MRSYQQKDKLLPADITIREIEEVESLRFNDPAKFKKLKGINYTYPELAEQIIHFRKPENFEEYCSLLRIRTKGAKLVPFNFKRAQKVFWNLFVKKDLLEGKPVRQYVLKARQIGFSTLIEAILYWKNSLFCNNYANIFAHDKTKSAEIFNMTKMFYKTTPKEFQATRKLSNRHELYFANPNEQGDLGIESKILVDTADNVHIGAGSTIQFAHMSEFARYESVNKNIRLSMATFFQAVPDEDSMIFLETTAYGGGLGKEYWDDDKNGFNKLFVSWLAEDEYRTNFKIDPKVLVSNPEDRYGDEINLRDGIINQLRIWYPEYANDNEWYETESLHRLAWRRKTIDEKAIGDKDFFRQEYPTTADEAFISSGITIFNKDKLTAYLTYAERLEAEHSYARYTYLKPRDTTNKKDIGKFMPSEHGELIIYEHPVPGKDYFIGADVGYGVSGGDFSTARVLDENGNQVAVWESIIAPEEFGYPLVALAAYYNKAFINPEANAPGIALIVRIKELGYWRMYQRESFSSINNNLTHEYGFHTNARTKPMVISLLREGIAYGTILLRHVRTIKQLFQYTMDSEGKLTAPPGQHDDLVMGLALAVKILPSEKEILENQNLKIRANTLFAIVEEMDRMIKSGKPNIGNVTGI